MGDQVSSTGITVTELAALGTQASVVDVRERDEYDAAHVDGVRLIPLSEFGDRVGEVPSEGTVYLICASGARSARVTAFLRERGFDAVNVIGGTNAWIAAGLPVVAAV